MHRRTVPRKARKKRGNKNRPSSTTCGGELQKIDRQSLKGLWPKITKKHRPIEGPSKMPPLTTTAATTTYTALGPDGFAAGKKGALVHLSPLSIAVGGGIPRSGTSLVCFFSSGGEKGEKGRLVAEEESFIIPVAATEHYGIHVYTVIHMNWYTTFGGIPLQNWGVI